MTKTALFLGGSILGVVAVGALACLFPETEFTPEQKKERKKIVDKCVEDIHRIANEGFAKLVKDEDNSTKFRGTFDL